MKLKFITFIKTCKFIPAARVKDYKLTLQSIKGVKNNETAMETTENLNKNTELLTKSPIK